MLKAIIEADGGKLLIDGLRPTRVSASTGTLVESVVHEGEYEFYVCSCGEAGCAGLFVSQGVRYDGNVIVWKVIEPKPEGEYRFDRDEYLKTVHDAFTGAGSFKQGEWTDFNICPYGFFLDTFTKCLERLTRWRALRKEGVGWDEIAKKYPNEYTPGKS